MNEKRQLKVGYCSQERKRQKQLNFYPKLTLQGKWFARAGFVIGEFTTVIVADGIIQIINDTGCDKVA